MDVAVGARGILVSQGELGPLMRTDYAGRPVRRLDAGRDVISVAAYGWAYAADAATPRIVRIDQSSDRLVASRRLPLTPLAEPSAVASNGRSLWLLARRGRGASLLGLHPTSLRVRRVLHLRRRPVMELGAHAVWLAVPGARHARSRLVAIGAVPGRILARRWVAGSVRGLASSADGLWVLAESARRRGRVTLLEPRAGRPIRGFAGTYAPGAIAARSDDLWVASLCAQPRCDASRPRLRAYDPATGALRAGPFATFSCGDARVSRRPSWPCPEAPRSV